MQLDKADISGAVINEVLTEENRAMPMKAEKAPDWIPDHSIDCDEDLPWTCTVPVLAKPHTLKEY